MRCASGSNLKSLKVRLSTLEHLDRRTGAARRAAALILAMTNDLGGQLSPGLQSAVRRAALLSVLAEDATIRQLADGNYDMDQLVRLCNAARRAVLDLGIAEKSREKRVAPAQALKEHLARRAITSLAVKP